MEYEQGLSVLRVGSTVTFVRSEVTGTILAIMVDGEGRPDNVTYKIAWWEGEKRHEEWVSSREIKTQEHSRYSWQKIGFVNNDGGQNEI